METAHETPYSAGDRVRLVSIDHDGLCGRDRFPLERHVGLVFEVVRVEPLDPEDTDDSSQVLICRYGFGHEAELLDLADYEVERAEPLPTFFHYNPAKS